MSLWLFFVFSASAQDPATFHHIHLNTLDPASNMEYFSRNHGSIKVILQGLGVGVRNGTSYLLFERTDDDPPPLTGDCRDEGRCFEDARSRLEMFPGGSAVYKLQVFSNDPAPAVGWFTRHLGTLGPIEFVAHSGPLEQGRVIDHVAFSYPLLQAAVDRLQAEGVKVLEHRPRSVIVEGPEGLHVEIVEDTEVGGNAYWCPMDPKVRSAKPGKCPICGMKLVPLDPGEYVRYPVNLTVSPNPPRVGRPVKLDFSIRNPHNDVPIKNFEEVHTKLLHLFVVSDDMTFFEHIHPVLQPDGSFTIETTLPKAGPYQAFADFFPSGGSPQIVQKAFVTAGYTGSLLAARAHLTADADADKVVEGTRVHLDCSGYINGLKETLTFTVSDAKTGAPVKDLVPWLGAWAHMLILSEDLGDYVHGHASLEQSADRGSQLIIETIFPRPANYRLWIQFGRGDKVITVPFNFTVHRLR